MGHNDTVIRVDDDVATLINVFDVDPSKQQELVDVLVQGTQEVVRHRPGFVSVNLLASDDGTRVVNYAQWRTLEDIKATLADPEAQAVLQQAAALGRPAPHVYSVVSVHHA